MKNTFHQKVFFISILLHAEKRSLKSPPFKFEKNKKNDLTSRPYSSKPIIGISFNFTLNFSSGIRLQLMFLENHQKMNFKGSYAIFPKPSVFFTFQPHRRDSPASPYLSFSNIPNEFVSNGKVLSGALEIANCVNEFFSEIGPRLAKQIPKSKNHFSSFLSNPCTGQFVFGNVTSIFVEEALNKLKNKNSAGLDKVSSSLLKCIVWGQ